MRAQVLVAAALLGLGAAPAAAQRAIALAPLLTLGSEDTSQAAGAATAQLERALAQVAGAPPIAAAQVTAALKRARRPGVAACDGELPCLAEAGRAVSADVLVTGQLGGIGEARVVYLSAVDTATAKELGSTTWSADPTDSAEAAVVRLLAPAQYVGALRLELPLPSASVYINGKKHAVRGDEPLSLPVGTHALRVTSPEVRDFVRFVDVRYRQTTTVAVELKPLPVVQRDVATAADRHRRGQGQARPWYQSWWAVAGGAGALALAAGMVTYFIADDFSPDVTLP